MQPESVVQARTSSVQPLFRRPKGKNVPREGEDGLFTQSWYPICLSSAASVDFVRGFDFLDGRVIVFRDKAGNARVMSAYPQADQPHDLRQALGKVAGGPVGAGAGR